MGGGEIFNQHQAGSYVWMDFTDLLHLFGHKVCGKKQVCWNELKLAIADNFRIYKSCKTVY